MNRAPGLQPGQGAAGRCCRVFLLQAPLAPLAPLAPPGCHVGGAPEPRRPRTAELENTCRPDAHTHTHAAAVSPEGRQRGHCAALRVGLPRPGSVAPRGRLGLPQRELCPPSCHVSQRTALDRWVTHPGDRDLPRTCTDRDARLRRGSAPSLRCTQALPAPPAGAVTTLYTRCAAAPVCGAHTTTHCLLPAISRVVQTAHPRPIPTRCG